MTERKNQTVFESLNARQLTPEQTAQSFVPTSSFSQLLEHNHNVIIGPRGSGKTTLLKMLQLRALNSWKHPEAENYFQRIDFVSAFIPTDISWKEQWGLIDSLNESVEKKILLKNAVFSTHTLQAMIQGFAYRASPGFVVNNELGKFHLNLDRESESRVASSIAENIGLELRIPSLDYVELQLRNRLVRIGDYVNRVRSGSDVQDDLEFIYPNFLDTISLTIDILNSAAGNDQQKWALLFDELELAPREIRRGLISNTRSTDSRILFKLSISPYSEDFHVFADAHSPSAGNDYIPINLWYSHKEDARAFCDSLFRQMASSLGLGSVTPAQVFDTSEFELGNVTRDGGENAYRKGSPIHARFRSLKKKDATFAEYLSKRRINIDAMDEMSEHQRASKVRKITNIVSVREAWRRDDGGLSSKRKPSLYTGATSLFDVTEGNPRLFIGIVGTLLRQYADERKTISSSRQSNAVAQASNRFRALLSTVPIRQGVGAGAIKGLNDLLDIIGRYFFRKTVVERFTADPPTSFIVDGNTPSAISEALGRALNAGAIVYMEDDPGNPLLNTLIGKRFRITYLLAPHYKLPMIASKSRELSKILNDSANPVEPDLFNEFGG